MAHVYTVEFHFGAERPGPYCQGRRHGDRACDGVICKCVLAEDRYEALQLARQLLALQDPAVDVDDVRMYQVLRQDIAPA